MLNYQVRDIVRLKCFSCNQELIYFYCLSIISKDNRTVLDMQICPSCNYKIVNKIGKVIAHEQKRYTAI